MSAGLRGLFAELFTLEVHVIIIMGTQPTMQIFEQANRETEGLELADI